MRTGRSLSLWKTFELLLQFTCSQELGEALGMETSNRSSGYSTMLSENMVITHSITGSLWFAGRSRVGEVVEALGWCI